MIGYFLLAVGVFIIIIGMLDAILINLNSEIINAFICCIGVIVVATSVCFIPRVLDAKEIYMDLSTTRNVYEQALENKELSTSKILLANNVAEFNKELYEQQKKVNEHNEHVNSIYLPTKWENGDYVKLIQNMEPISISDY